MFNNFILFYKHHVSDHDEMLEKGPGCKANINWLKKPAEKYGNLTENYAVSYRCKIVHINTTDWEKVHR